MKTSPWMPNHTELLFISCTSILRNQMDLGRIENYRSFFLSMSLVRTPKDSAAKEKGDSCGQRLVNLVSERRMQEDKEEQSNSAIKL